MGAFPREAVSHKVAWAILQTATLSVAVLVIARVFPDFCSARYRKGFFQGVFQGFVAVVRLPREKADCRPKCCISQYTGS